jgi:hypothetical protein
VDCSRYQICTWKKRPPAPVSWPSRELALSNERGTWASCGLFRFHLEFGGPSWLLPGSPGCHPGCRPLGDGGLAGGIAGHLLLPNCLSTTASPFPDTTRAHHLSTFQTPQHIAARWDEPPDLSAAHRLSARALLLPSFGWLLDGTFVPPPQHDREVFLTTCSSCPCWWRRGPQYWHVGGNRPGVPCKASFPKMSIELVHFNPNENTPCAAMAPTGRPSKAKTWNLDFLTQAGDLLAESHRGTRYRTHTTEGHNQGFAISYPPP